MSYSAAYVWAKILGHLEKTLPLQVITWFDDTEVLELTEEQLVLFTPTEFRKDMILKRCKGYICDAMKDLFDKEVSLEVLYEKELQEYKNRNKTPEFIEFNPQFTFDNFVVGSSNNFAHGAAIAVSHNPAGSYNPLFIYGPSGLGKTHLLYAIAGQIHKDHPDYNIVYIKGDQFTIELIEALRAGKNFEFRKKYRNADLFLVDDIQFIAGKDSTQEEFFHTFNNLYENHKQIVLTSDRSPSEMTKLEDRLKTRFEWGLLADIKPPDYETRMAIIKNKAVHLNLDLPDDVCSFIAENITSNVRQIEGTVKKIKAYHDLQNMTLDITNIRRVIRDLIDREKPDALPTTALIISEVCRYFSVEENVLRSTLKNKKTAEARQIAMYLIRELLHLSLPEIGKEFGRDHTTVLHSCDKIQNLLKDPDSVLHNKIRDITANINNKV